ncbi:DUF4435 domain-containing protein [Dysgonomonas sp. GY617]|uniref:DUF4435 domain-containing protein n=1 Tax=Dysgonomonas sp. GY617 TaxID=2780420 RepID=UPI0018832936|nr:DUF4435 domain-containing protein [Dysgonomonas sp. GY617]MBF0578107.1 DUF4435 domain-containing protein [Dysgonomonas sp. GY617]
MRSNVDATDKINDIRLSLNSETGSKMIWVLVEGEDDCKIYPKFFYEDKARVEFVNGGKGQLTSALDTLTRETRQVIGIRDADFLHLEGNYPDVINLFYTDYHDIEMTMLHFETVRCNLLVEYRLQNREDIWHTILNESAYYAYIRWYNDIKCCRILFSGLGLGRFVDVENLSIKRQDLLDELNKRSRNKTEEILCNNIDCFITENRTEDFLNLCNGHDVTALLALYIGGQVSHAELCRHLRLSFKIQDFHKTKLYRAISDWQARNGFSFLKSAI